MNSPLSPKKPNGLFWPDLIPGVLIKRYKRFLADVELQTGRVVTAHCPNSGSMAACCEPGRPVFLSYHDSPKRKLKYTWEMIDMPTSLVGVNTLVPNRLVHLSLQEGLIRSLHGYQDIRREAKINAHTRLDLVLTGGKDTPCYVEIKNCTLVNDRMACFPDAVTVRGQKHLAELEKLKKAGCRCVIFFLVQRMDADLFRPADHIDPAYGHALRQAFECGVEIMVYDVHLDLKMIKLNRKIPYRL